MRKSKRIRMHYLFGGKQQVACGKRNVLMTTNYREITCGLCKRTVAHRAVAAQPILPSIAK